MQYEQSSILTCQIQPSTIAVAALSKVTGSFEVVVAE